MPETPASQARENDCDCISKKSSGGNHVTEARCAENNQPTSQAYFSKPKGSSTEWAGWVNQRAPVSVMTMWSSRRTPNSP